jgi:hypothetical protein
VIGFTAPWALLGLVAAGIPLLLHLFARREPPTVVFPATRYLAETARAHHRRLTLQHWLLLVVRTLLIAALAFAAAGPTMPSGGVASHAPAALAIILDNSPSSGATVEGTPMLEDLRRAARDVLAAAHADDALWLMTADGIPRKGTPRELLDLVDRISPAPFRLDLGAAITGARETLSGQALPGTVVVLSDLQATALSAAAPPSRPAALVVVRPGRDPVVNSAITGLGPGRQPWGPEGGRVSVAVSGDPARGAALSVRFGTRLPRQQVVHGGTSVSVSSGALPAGWWIVRAELEPDELRVDDLRQGAVRVAPAARAACRSEDRFLAVACDVLFANGRLVRGNDVTIGWLGSGASIVQPPEDRSALGALNRAFAARGIPWSYGDPVPGAGSTDSNTILSRHPVARRHTLEGPPASARREVLVTVGGAPWLVRSGNVLLLGSRLDPGWTELPVSAEFVPFIDFLANRAVPGDLAFLETAPGEAITMPAAATALIRDGVSRPVQGTDRFRPTELGVFFILSNRDTIGVLAVNPDPRESALARARDAAVRQLWTGARVVSTREAREASYAAGGRADLRGWMLGLAALLALADASLAGWGRKRRRNP